jgi:hypothetical protein
MQPHTAIVADVTGNIWAVHLIVRTTEPTREFADSTVVRKWKLLLVNGCGCKSPISKATVFLNSFQDDTYVLETCVEK